eukprot:jgi/Astpho2/3166/Aster-05699
MAKELARGISSQGRSKSYHRRGIWAVKKKNNGEFPKHAKQPKAEAKEAKAARFYPADDVKQPLRRRDIKKPTRLRSSIQPGSVLILLAGRFKGKRVVFLKQLDSGLLLVTGPFQVNGVPLRRVNQAYVIATSAQVDISKVDVSTFDDTYFKKQEAAAKKGEEKFFQDESSSGKTKVSEGHVQDQKKVDAALIAAIKGDVKGYLATRFTLSKNDRPHLMKF